MCISFDFRSLTVGQRNASGDGFDVSQYEVADENELWADWVVVRVQFSHSIDAEAEAASATYKEAVHNALKELEVTITSSNPPVFNVEDTDINLHAGKTVNGVAIGSTVGDVLLELEDADDDDKKPKEKRTPDVLNLDSFLNLACDANNGEEGKNTAIANTVETLLIFNKFYRIV